MLTEHKQDANKAFKIDFFMQQLSNKGKSSASFSHRKFLIPCLVLVCVLKEAEIAISPVLLHTETRPKNCFSSLFALASLMPLHGRKSGCTPVKSAPPPTHHHSVCVPACRTQMRTDLNICSVNSWSPVLSPSSSLTRNCRLISFTVSLATLPERLARFQQETECGSGVIIYCRAQALIFADMLYSVTPLYHVNFNPSHQEVHNYSRHSLHRCWLGYWLDLLAYI